MATVTFGDYPADMRFEDEDYLLPWFEEFFAYLDAFEPVRENVLNESAVQYKVLQFDAEDRTLTITMEGDIDAGTLDLLQIEALGVLQSITGSFVVDQFGDIDGTATGIRVDVDPFQNGDLQLLVNFTDVSVPLADPGNDADLLSGADIISGGSGNDYLLGYAGADSISGAAGNDTLKGGNGNDTLLGGAGNDSLLGGSGNDSITGYDGADTLKGWLGSDTLKGGRGDDTYVADAGDVLVEYAGSGTDTVKTAVSFVLGNNFENLNLSGAASVDGRGNSLANSIIGNIGNNVLEGAGGNDLLKGARGADTLNGGLGNDTLLGGIGADRLIGHTGNDSLSGWSGADTLLGWAGNDTLLGGGDNDTLNGGNGIDVLAGGLGSDLLIGGDGADAFAFDAPLSADNIDTVSDFVPGSDVLRLDEDVFGAFAAGVAVSAAQFHAGAGVTSAGDADDRLIYDSSTGALYYDIDGNGEASAIQFALIGTTTHPTLAAGDFVIVG